MKDLASNIIEAAKRAFSEANIDLFIGYENGTVPLRTTPVFVTKPDQAINLVWNSFCSNNLAVYLPKIINAKNKKFKRVGILCKGCDSRSVVGLIREKQIKREDVFILGVACPGMVDAQKLLKEIGDQEIIGISEDKDNIIVDLKGGQKKLVRREYIHQCCLYCNLPKPLVHDILIGDAELKNAAASIDSAENLRGQTRQERWQAFERAMSKCIRCYACRNACPNCYCKECFAEQTKPKWLGVAADKSDIMFYHIGRIFHQAGRCVDCGACVRSCPMDIDLRQFTHFLVDEVKQRYGYEPGLALEEPTLLGVFKADDKQEFMTEPE